MFFEKNLILWNRKLFFREVFMRLHAGLFYIGYLVLLLGGGAIIALFQIRPPGFITATHIFYWLGFSGASFGGAMVGKFLDL